jgi:hypothetical protein
MQRAQSWAHTGDLKKSWTILHGTKTAAMPVDAFRLMPGDKLNTGQLLLNQLRADLIKDINAMHTYLGVSFVHRLVYCSQQANLCLRAKFTNHSATLTLSNFLVTFSAANTPLTPPIPHFASVSSTTNLFLILYLNTRS